MAMEERKPRPENPGFGVAAQFATGAIALGVLGTQVIFTSAGSEIAGSAPIIAAAVQGLMLGGTSFLMAAIVGLLFAVPRSPDMAAGSAANSNLAQVSDWVTKMLAGAALVGLANQNLLWGWLQHVGKIGDGGEWSGRVGATVVAYFATVGFLSGYLTGRTGLGELLGRTNTVERGFQILLNHPAGGRVRLTLNDLAAVQAVLTLNRNDLRNDAERRLWAKAQLIGFQGDLRRARIEYERLLKRNPSPELYAEYVAVSEALGEKPRRYEPKGRESPTEKDDTLPPSVAIESMFANLYEPAPEGFNRVLELGEALVGKVQDERLWAYLACAYGQKHAWLQKTDGTPTDISAARESALFSVKQALDLDPTWRTTFRSMWDANAIRPDGDDDLVSFSGDPQFAALLEPEAVNRSLALASSIELALTPQRLVKYRGKVQAAARDGRYWRWAVQPCPLRRPEIKLAEIQLDQGDPDKPS